MWTFTTKRCKSYNMFSLWRAVTSKPNLRWVADGSSVGHPSEKVLLCQGLLSVSTTTEKVWELWSGIHEELKGERNLQAISQGPQTGYSRHLPLVKFRFNNWRVSPFQHSAECQSTAPFLWASRRICIGDYLQIYLCGFSCLKVTTWTIWSFRQKCAPRTMMTQNKEFQSSMILFLYVQWWRKIPPCDGHLQLSSHLLVSCCL